MWLGIAIVATHIFMVLYFSFVFDAPDAVIIQEIGFPITIAYVSAIVVWFFQHDGLITSERLIGVPLVILVSLIVVAMLGSLIATPFVFDSDPKITVDQINTTYLSIESGFGGMFGIIMAQLFGYKP